MFDADFFFTLKAKFELLVGLVMFYYLSQMPAETSITVVFSEVEIEHLYERNFKFQYSGLSPLVLAFVVSSLQTYLLFYYLHVELIIICVNSMVKWLNSLALVL
jgi:hypothetical protein